MLKLLSALGAWFGITHSDHPRVMEKSAAGGWPLIVVQREPLDDLQQLPHDVRVVVREVAEMPERNLRQRMAVSAVAAADRSRSVIRASSPK